MATAPVVGITADRRWEEQASLFRRRGIDVLHGPSMRTIELSRDERLRAVTRAVIADPPEWLVATTGMGMRQWFDAAESWGVREALVAALGQARVVARGAKAASAVRQAGLDVSWRAPRESMADVVDHVRAAAGVGAGGDAGASGPAIAVQLFDPDDHPSTAELRAIADRFVEVPVYRWLLPADTGPAETLIRAATDGGLAAITFTSQPAVRFLFAIAEGIGQREALVAVCNAAIGGADAGARVLPVCIGPVCAEAGAEVGLTGMVWPEPFRLPPMVRLTAERLGVEAAPASPSQVSDPLA